MVTIALEIVEIPYLHQIFKQIDLVKQKYAVDNLKFWTLLSCQPRLTVMSSFVYKVIRDL